MRIALLATILAFSATAANAQQKSVELMRYSVCQYGKDFQVAEVHELESEIDRPNFGEPSKTVHLLDGYSIYVAYKEDEAFANVKIEQLRDTTYEADSKALIEGLQHMAANSKGLESTTPSKSESNGFDVYGINFTSFDSNILAVYLLLNPKTHTATTIYLLNDYPETRKFSTIAQFHTLRDAFLTGMLSCFKQ